MRSKEEIVAEAGHAQDVAARDDAHLRSLGIKPELQRTLGFLSNFAVAFSYISVSTGTFTLFAVGIGVGGPAFFWAWPLVILGQTFVALNFAELASHFPVAGSIYQWSKRLSNKTLGWFTGWIYFWAGVLTTTAVAVTVPLVLSTVLGFDLGAPSIVPALSNLVFVAMVTLIITTIINAFGVRLLALINNIGVGAEILGLAVFGLILLIFFNHQPLSVLTQTAGLENQPGVGIVPVFLVAMFMALFVVYGFDTAGTFGEETLDAGRQAPRGVLSAIWLSGAVGVIFLLAIILSFKDMAAGIASGQNFGLPIADTLIENLGDFGKVYLTVILIAVFVCTLAIQGATTRLMFSMGRDRRLPLGSVWGHVNPTFKTPANAAVAVGVLSAIPFLATDSPLILATAATGMIYLSYFLCNLGVFSARVRGWPQKGAWFSLRGWGTVINGLALLWGGLMLINFALWRSDLFGAFGTATYNLADGTAFALRDLTNPLINETISIGGNVLSGLPAIPIFEFMLGIVVLVGIIYYLAADRGDATSASLEPDLATGEAVIG
ncbi:MAG: amino acid permease [Chloroflexi bacterium]|nr:amino acid permease [Chloroflexota bacterium]